MELKPGYKRTEAGIIPEDWGVKPLGSTLRKGRLGGNYPNRDQETEFPLIKMGNLDRGQMDVSKLEYIPRGVEIDPTHQLSKGDVLFNTRNTLDLVGKVAIWRNELPVAYYNSNLMRLEFDPLQIVSNEYANAAMNTAVAVANLRALATGTTSVAAIYTRDLMDLPIVLPPPREQYAIAAALNDIHALLDGQERLISKKHNLKQAAMQQLLTGQTRFAGFDMKLGLKQTEVGVIPQDWEVKRLGNIATIATGNTPPTNEASNYGDEFLFVGPVDMGEKKFVWETEKKLSPKGFALSRRFPKHSILFVSIGSSIGKCGIAPVELTSNQQINAIFPSSSFSVEYLYYALIAAAPRIRAQAGEQAVPIVNKMQFSLTAIALPSLPEQVAIAAALAEMDAELVALELRLAKTRNLKQAMMQELLTGKTRLVAAEVAHA